MDETTKEKFWDLFTKQGVYGRLKCAYQDFYDLICDKPFQSIDLYCQKCRTNKTCIHNGGGWIKEFGSILNDGYAVYQAYILRYICPTCRNNLWYILYYDTNKESVIKLAQYPTLYDVTPDELKKYKKNDLIDEESFNQIYKADTCASESYFIAAYTYMRRVYESLLVNIFTQNKEEIGISEEDFKKLRSDEKIAKIKPFLAIDDEIYKPLYALLSAGIHSLTEEECCEDYTLLKSILLDIIAEQKARKEKEDKRKSIIELYSKRKGEQN
ncbi:MAG: hypothetical protein K2N58_00175 [Treponemataceae bacterium]|nr:hypothetical protein [Treponemataceae bacterium]